MTPGTGVRQFFLNGGTEAYVVRVGAVAPPAAPADLPVAAANLLTGGGVDMFNAVAARRIRGAVVENPGEWGNFLRLEVDYDVVERSTTPGRPARRPSSGRGTTPRSAPR